MTEQITFGMYEDSNRRKKASMLDDIANIIDFKRVDAMLLTMYDGKTGRPPIPPLMLFKMLILESWYGLSDVAVVQEIHDRRSFERFIGESVRKYHVDDTTLVKFRERLREAGLMDKIWNELQNQFTKKGLIVKRGTIIDSTIVKAACSPNSKKKNGEKVDNDAGYTVRGSQVKDGMKVHIATDKDNGMVQTMDLSRIEEHDHNHFYELIPVGTTEVYADKAYFSAEHKKYLKKKDIFDGVMTKGARGKQLSEAEVERNKTLSSIRCRVEARINDLKNWCGMKRMRYYGLLCNAVWMLICGMACNLKRAVKLMAS